jgi:hypothetical protein
MRCSKGLSPERKARAALFLARFREHARMAMRHGGPHGAGPRGRGASESHGASADDGDRERDRMTMGDTDPSLDPEL